MPRLKLGGGKSKAKRSIASFNPFKKLIEISRKAKRTAVKRKVKDFEGVPDKEIVMRADKALSR